MGSPDKSMTHGLDSRARHRLGRRLRNDWLLGSRSPESEWPDLELTMLQLNRGGNRSPRIGSGSGRNRPMRGSGTGETGPIISGPTVNRGFARIYLSLS